MVAKMMATYKAAIHIRPGSKSLPIYLILIMLSLFHGNGHYVTCNFAYMGDIMALIACNVLKINNNMVGTVQANWTGAPMGASVKGDQAIKKKTYEYKMWQHNTQSSLVAAVWSDNNLVKTLSNNYHQPQIIPAGMMRQKIRPDGVREKDATPVNAPMQNVDYSDTYYQINKGNKEARNMAGHPSCCSNSSIWL